MSRPPNRCVYCGDVGISKEHLRGDWSVKYGRRFDRTSHVVGLPNPLNPETLLNPGKGAADRPGTPRAMTLKIACESCNNGWMSIIQNEAISILRPMSHGYWGAPGKDKLLALARWITLFTMSYEFVDRKTACVEYAERNRFMATTMPSSNWHIAIGFAEPVKWDEKTFHRAFEAYDPDWNGNKKFHFTAFLFGKLIVLSHYSEYPLDFDFAFLARDFGLSPIWPIIPDRLLKPLRIHDDESVALLIARATDVLQKRNALLGL